MGDDYLSSAVVVLVGNSCVSFLAERDLSAERQIDLLYSEIVIGSSTPAFLGVLGCISTGTFAVWFSLLVSSKSPLTLSC